MYNTYETTIINKHVGNGENGEFEGLSANPLAGFTCQISWSLSERSQQSLHLGPQDTTGGIPAVGSTSCSRSDKTFCTTGSVFQLKGAAKACSASQHMMILRTEGDAQSVGCHHKKLKHGTYMGGS